MGDALLIEAKVTGLIGAVTLPAMTNQGFALLGCVITHNDQ